MKVADRPEKQTCTCMCGGTMVRKVGTITKVIRGQTIRIHKVPFYECLSCDEREFELSTRISSIAVKAYKLGIHDVTWSKSLFLDS